jgi:hypothetical protein
MKRQYETSNIIQEPGTPLKPNESDTPKREFFDIVKKGLFLVINSDGAVMNNQRLTVEGIHLKRSFST